MYTNIISSTNNEQMKSRNNNNYGNIISSSSSNYKINQKQKQLKINPHLENMIQIVRTNTSAKNIVYSPVENVMKSLKRNICLTTKTDIPQTQIKSGDVLLNNPYISEDVKNKYSEIYIDTFTNASNNNNNDNQGMYNNIKTAPNINTNIINHFNAKAKKKSNENQNDNLCNKKKELYSLLSNGDDCDFTYKNEEEIKQKFRELSGNKYYDMPPSKITVAKKQIEKMIDGVNKRNYINTCYKKNDKIRLFSPESVMQKYNKGINNNNNTKPQNNKYTFTFNHHSNIKKGNNNTKITETMGNDNVSRIKNSTKDKISYIHRRCLSNF